jgi:hypothetical protein
MDASCSSGAKKGIQKSVREHEPLADKVHVSYCVGKMIHYVHIIV